MAGPVLHAQGGPSLVLRQRCAWCGAILIDDHLAATDVGTKFTFEAQSQVAVQNGCAWAVSVGAGLAAQSCLHLDPYVTR